MNQELRALLKRHGGVVRQDEASRVVPVWALGRAFRARQIRRPLPGVYVDAAMANDPDVLRRAALRYADGRGALSHTTALGVWGLRSAGRDEPVHLSVPFDVRLRPHPPVLVHQRRRLRIEAPDVVPRAAMLVTRLEMTLVDAWPLIPPAERPAPLIRAIRERWTTPPRVLSALDAEPRLADRAAMRALLDRLASGCHSELEIWGHDHVFVGPDMPRFERQYAVRVGGRTFHLDVWAPEERVNFELDGAASHGAPDQREADLRRDASLATLDIKVVRFSHSRLVREPEAVRREIVAVLAAARRRA